MSKAKLPVITEYEDVRGKFVLLRSSLNVPMEDGKIANHFRLIRSLPTIEWLVREGARVIICGHIGREKENTLEPIYQHLKQCLQADVFFSKEVVGPITKNLSETLEEGQVLVIENLRRDPRETKNDADFARSLADLADIYVNDAFDASHREHASIIGVPEHLPAYAGITFAREYDELTKAVKPKSPSLFILGGAKFETKMPLVEKFLEVYDHALIGGALANDFYKARGLEVGKSLTSDIDLTGEAIVTNEKIILPSDVVVVNQKGDQRVTNAETVAPDEMIMDAGPNSIHQIELFTRNAKNILWNGPLGNYEGGYGEQTLACAKLVADSPAYTLVGGGDTTAAIESLNNYGDYSFVSTAGGAMLTFLEHGTLPGIAAIQK